MQICKIVHVHINPSFLVLSYLLHARTIIIVVVVFVVIIIIIIIIIMCGVCSSYGGDKCMKWRWSENLKGRGHSEDLGIDGKIILKLILGK